MVELLPKLQQQFDKLNYSYKGTQNTNSSKFPSAIPEVQSGLLEIFAPNISSMEQLNSLKADIVTIPMDESKSYDGLSASARKCEDIIKTAEQVVAMKVGQSFVDPVPVLVEETMTNEI